MVAINDDFLGGLKKRQVFIKGPYTDMELTQSMQNFSSAVSSAHSVAGSASQLKTKKSNSARNKTDNYYLTQEEKNLIKKRAGEFAVPGIVPFDVLEDFLYVLCYIDDYPNMKMVSDVTGVEGLDNADILREPLVILNLTDLGKIAYLANGLAALTKQLDSERYPQASTASQADSSAYSGISQMIASGNPMSAFPGLGSIVSLVTQVSTLATAATQMSSMFSSEGNVVTKINQISGILSQTSSMITNVTSSLGLGGKNNITDTIPLLTKLSNLSAKVDMISQQLGMLSNVTSSNSFPVSKTGDVDAQMKSFLGNITQITSSLSSVVSAISGIKPPTGANIALAAETLVKNLSGGATPSEFLVGQILGQNIPQNILAKNPMSSAPSFAATALFGASSATALHYRDGKQFPAVPIAIFKTAAAGAGTAAFGMQNSSALGGVMSLASAVTSLIGNVSSAAASMHIENVSNILGAAATASTELRRSDNAIPIMIGLATSFSNDTSCPFPTGVFSEGWKIASAVGNMLQKEGYTIPT